MPDLPQSKPDAADSFDAERQDGALTHLDADGTARMVDVGGKQVTRRMATASCRVVMSPQTAQLIADADLPKGDALPVARIAGIQAAKRTHDLIPLCHPLAINAVDVEITVDVESGEAVVYASVTVDGRTGVEMEALTAASIAALTLYDMVKAVQRDVVIQDLRVLQKSGGRSGNYQAQIS